MASLWFTKIGLKVLQSVQVPFAGSVMVVGCCMLRSIVM